MENILTQEELKYLERISRYLLSTNTKIVHVDIEADPYDGGAQIDDINWEYITHFDWQGRIDIPSGFIEILKKIFNYIDKSGVYFEPDIDSLSYNEFIVTVNAEDKVLTITNDYRYYDVGGEEQTEIDDEPEIINNIKQSLGENIPEDGILTVTYMGGGDSGDLNGIFEETGDTIPTEVEDFCYNILSKYHGGFEHNEGGQGSIIFNLNDGIITIEHTDNIVAQVSDTLFEIKF
jgi:hypothetical protein